MNNARLKLLSEVHNVTSMAQGQIEALEELGKVEDYSDIPVELWHETFKSLHLTIDLQQVLVRRLFEEYLHVEDKFNERRSHRPPKE